jgi:outer membrane protein assembly factor BamB
VARRGATALLAATVILVTVVVPASELGATRAPADAPAATPASTSPTPVTPLAQSPGGAAIENVDWRPGIINHLTTELYSPVDTGGTLVVGLVNRSASPMTVTGVTLDGRTVSQLRTDRHLQWWRFMPESIPAGGVGAVTVKLLAPYRTGADVTVAVATTAGTVSLQTTLVDAPVRLANVTLDAAGEELLVWVRNDGSAFAELPGYVELDGQTVEALPSQSILSTGDVAVYQLPAPGSGTRPRFVSIGVRADVGGDAARAYAHLKVAPAFNAAGGYGNSSSRSAEQAALGLNLVTRGPFTAGGGKTARERQLEWNADFCTKGIHVWLADVHKLNVPGGSLSDAELAEQVADPCVAGIGRDEPEFGPSWTGSLTEGFDGLQAFVDELTRQSRVADDQVMHHITNAIGRVISSFAYIADVAGNDHYAVDTVSSDGDSSHPLQEAGYFAELTRRAAEPRPSYDWAQWSADDSWATGEAWNRQPTTEELRVQAYSMLQAGVKSLLWFTYNANRVAQHPDLAREVARINREMNLVFETVGEGAEAPGLASLKADSGSTPPSDVSALVGVDRVAVLVTNLDYSWQRVVKNKPIAPSPTPAAAFNPLEGMTLEVVLPTWIEAGDVSLVDPATGPGDLPFVTDVVVIDGESRTRVRADLPSITTTAMVVIVPDANGRSALEDRWVLLTDEIPGASAPDAPRGPVPPANEPWTDGRPDLEVVWEQETRDAILSSPAVDGEAVFVASRDGRVRAFDKGLGTPLWPDPIDLGQPVVTSPAVGSGAVVVGSIDGRLAVSDRDSGERRWTRELGAPVAATPVIVGPQVIVATDDGLVRAFDLDDDDLAWTADAGGPVLGGMALASVGGTPTLFVPSASGHVVAFNATTGAQRWRTAVGDQVLAAPAAADGRVVVGTLANRVLSLSATTGAVQWNVAVDAPVYRSPGLAQGQVVVGQGGGGLCIPGAEDRGFAGFTALNAASGAVQWKTRNLGCDFGHSQPVYGDNAWFGGTSLGSVVRINPVTGAVTASMETNGWVLATPVVAGDDLFVAADDQRLRVGSTRSETCGDFPSPFSDIAPTSTAFFARAARCLLDRGITTNNPYNPGGTVTRAQMAAFLWRFAESPSAPESCGFTDQAAIPSFARAATCWLRAEGITTNAAYNPGGTVTRAQMAAFLWRVAGSPAASSCTFSDSAAIPTWARSGACWLKDADITANAAYDPSGVVTRAQMAAFLYRTGLALDAWAE